MFRFALLFISLVFALPAFAQSVDLPEKAQAMEMFETDSQLLALYEMSNARCRGGFPNRLYTYENCALREVYGGVLEKRGYCNNEYDENGPTNGPAYIKCPSK